MTWLLQQLLYSAFSTENLVKIYYKNYFGPSICYNEISKTKIICKTCFNIPLCFQLSHLALKFGGGDLQNFHWKLFEKSMKIHMMPHVKVCILRTYHICWRTSKNFPLKWLLSIGIQQWHTHLLPSWLISQSTTLSQQLAKERFHTWQKSTTIWKAPWGLSHWETQDNPTLSQSVFDDLEPFPSWDQRVELFLFHKRKTRLPIPQGFSQIQIWIKLKTPIDTTTT